MEKEKNGDGQRRTADDGQTENNYKTPRGGGKACSLVYWQKKYWLLKPTDRRTTEDGGQTGQTNMKEILRRNDANRRTI